MIRKRGYLNLQNSATAATYVTDTLAIPGHLGRVYEDGSGYRGQLMQIVDAGAVAGDVCYNKSYTSFTATMTIGNTSAQEVAGVVTTTVAQNYYCLVQKGGIVNVKTAAAGSSLIARGTPMACDISTNRVIPGGFVTGTLAGTGVAAGDLFNWANPSAGAIIVTDLIVNRTTKSTGASTSDFGVAATAATSSDTLIDGLNTGATEANGENNHQNGGTNGKDANYMAAGTFITGSEASGDTTGLVGTVQVFFKPATLPRWTIIGTAQAAYSGGFVSTNIDIPYI